MLALVLILGAVSAAIAAFGYYAMQNDDLKEYKDAILIFCMFAIAAMVIFGIFAYDSGEPVQVAETDATESQPVRTATAHANSLPSLQLRSTVTPETTGNASNGASETLSTTAEVQPTAATLRSVGETFRDCEHCPKMVVVPAGDNDIGEEEGTPDARENEFPLAWVRFQKPFAVGQYEVKRSEFKAFAADTKFKPDTPCNTDGVGGKSASYANPALDQTDEHPVVCVSAHDAQAYVEWLSRKTGETYAVLSEARWEYVRRTETSVTQPPVSEDPDVLPEAGNVRGENWLATTLDVGRYHANQFLLFDMMGNAAEWTADCWQHNHSKQPKDGSAIRDDGDCSARAVRGGSWDERAEESRPARRRKVDASLRDWRIGFRVMRVLADTTEVSTNTQ